MHATSSTRWMVIAALGGCTVGDGGGGMLSGGVGASAGTTVTGAAESGDGGSSSDHGSSGSASAGEGGPTTMLDESSSAGTTSDAESDASSSSGAPSDSSGGSSSESGDDDLADGVLDITIVAYDDCTITTDPASITVPEGTEFTVNWISAASSVVDVDVAKIDRFNAVPIILGMEPGTSYHDEVRVWCGMLFTGTFDFEITSCFDPQYIPVDCGG